MTTSLSTGGGPVSYVQLSEGGFQVVYPLGLWSRFSGVVKVLYGYGCAVRWVLQLEGSSLGRVCVL